MNQASNHRPSSPQAAYQQALSQGFQHDPAQASAVALFEQLYQRLHQASATKSSWWPFAKTQTKAVTGLYLWGGVGRGKTWLMDMFYNSLDFPAKRRMHFHQFMNAIHLELKKLGERSDPLPQAVLAVIGDIRVLCFDEFFVSDIGDAMILAGVMHTLVDHGITLVATSNVEPDRLYYDGLQRARFLPAIELLKQHTQVMEMGNGDDFRLRALDQMNTFLVPHNEAHQEQLASDFATIAGETGHGGIVHINERDIPALRQSDGVVWFTFDTLCNGHRSAADYVELARQFHTIVLSNIPQLEREHNDASRRFIHLIDALYDHRVKLIASAAAEPQDLYQGTRLSMEFQRTSSRLIEMRSHDYLAEAHRP